MTICTTVAFDLDKKEPAFETRAPLVDFAPVALDWAIVVTYTMADCPGLAAMLRPWRSLRKQCAF